MEKNDRKEAARAEGGARADDASAGAGMPLFETELSRRPEGMRAERLVTADGTILRYALARPREGSVRGTVTILPGRADCMEHHYETIDDLLRRGFAVAILDWRGQGLSSRPLRNRLRGHVRSFRLYEADLRTFMRRVVLPECPPPHFALGISMGAHVLLHASWRHVWFERALLVSPMISIRRRRMPQWWWRLLSTAAVWAGLGWMFVPGVRKHPLREEDFPGNPLTSDWQRFRREALLLERHPQLALGGPTLGWLRAALASSRRLWKHAQEHDVPLWPLMAVAAGDDRLVDTEATRIFAHDVAGMACIVLQGARHDILLEADRYREALLAAFDSFIAGAGQGQEKAPQSAAEAPLPATTSASAAASSGRA